MNNHLLTVTAHRPAYLLPVLRQILPGFGLMILASSLSAPALADNTPESSDPMAVSPSSQLTPANLPPELQGKGKWAAFKTLWQQLAQIPAKQASTPPPDGRQFILMNYPVIHNQWPTVPNYEQRQYYLTLTAEMASQYRRELRSIFGHIIETPEAKLLYRLAEMRILEMSTSVRHSPDYTSVAHGEMLCRAMPPACMSSKPNAFSPTLYLVYAIDRLQTRTKALATLRKNEAISEDIYQSTLNAMMQETKLILYLDTIINVPYDQRYPSLWPYFGYLQPVDFIKEGKVQALEEIDLRHLAHWEQAIDARIKTLKTPSYPRILPRGRTDLSERLRVDIPANEFNNFLEKLQTNRKALDNLDPLLADLERP